MGSTAFPYDRDCQNGLQIHYVICKKYIYNKIVNVRNKIWGKDIKENTN